MTGVFTPMFGPVRPRTYRVSCRANSWETMTDVFYDHVRREERRAYRM